MYHKIDILLPFVPF